MVTCYDCPRTMSTASPDCLWGSCPLGRNMYDADEIAHLKSQVSHLQCVINNLLSVLNTLSGLPETDNMWLVTVRRKAEEVLHEEDEAQ